MSRIHSFPPLSDDRAERLVLGSMPGKASLLAQQYYAHPRNAFWPIMESLFGIARTLPYAQRCTRLVARRVAVWDVLKTCTRSSSLDSDIDPSTIVANDFVSFFVDHPGLQAIYFNGAMAENTFRRHVLPLLPPAAAQVPMTRLPSTSPANAAYSLQQKLESWRVIAD